MDLYLEELERALQSGDATVASELARILADQKLNLKLQLNEAPAQNLPEKKINVKIIIEDRYTTNVSVTLSLLPSMKFTELKALMFEQFEFPPQTQRWMAGKRLAKDAEMLRNCGIRKDNDIIYLYLVSAQSVGLTREAVEVQPRRHTYSDTDAGRQEQFLIEAGNPLVATPGNNTVQGTTIGWQCHKCTFINEPTRPGCSVCSTSRPDDYVIPPVYDMSDGERMRLEQERRFEEEAVEERNSNFQQLVAAEETSLILNTEAFECPVCFDDVPPLEGVVLRDCLHTFCKECLLNQIRHADSSAVMCPSSDEQSRCTSTLQDREIKALVPLDMYQKHLTLSLVEAESRSANSFHCQTPNCIGWCIYEDFVNLFRCDVCNKENCLTCKAIHEGITCKQFQDDVKIKAKNDVAAKQTQEKLEAMLQKGDAMKCPTCDIIVTKKDGCDWLRCTMCKTEICWVTKGPRWGPLGSGDTAGGCRCGVDGKSCHRNCQNCH